MDITINQTEIMDAIKNYINTQGINVINKALDVNFTVGRGANGASASISLTPIKNAAIEDTNIDPGIKKLANKNPKDSEIFNKSVDNISKLDPIATTASSDNTDQEITTEIQKDLFGNADKKKQSDPEPVAEKDEIIETTKSTDNGSTDSLFQV